MNLAFLSQRIREFRRKRMLTLEQLAERSQLTQSVLSKVENSRVTPSLAALSRIAAALGVTLSELVEGIDEERPMLIVRRGKAPLHHSDNPNGSLEFRSLAPTRHQKKIEPLAGKLSPNTEWSPLPLHHGEIFIFITNGSIEIRSGEETGKLKNGDALHFDSVEQIEIRNPADSPAKFLCILSGDRPGDPS